MESENIYYATGKRKTAIARTWIQPGSGEVRINGRPLDEYFTVESSRGLCLQPLILVNARNDYDVRVHVIGGGPTGQAGAIRHGITRALIEAKPELRQQLKRAGFVMRDPRKKERKKYGQRGARARFQFSKR
jgi:small subunit ribosomal protein S9